MKRLGYLAPFALAACASLPPPCASPEQYTLDPLEMKAPHERGVVLYEGRRWFYEEGPEGVTISGFVVGQNGYTVNVCLAPAPSGIGREIDRNSGGLIGKLFAPNT